MPVPSQGHYGFHSFPVVDYDEYRISIERASNIRNAFIISAGDFNLPGWDWSQNIIKQNTKCIANHEKFADILEDEVMYVSLTAISTPPPFKFLSFL
jgi:hypothetical protein